MMLLLCSALLAFFPSVAEANVPVYPERNITRRQIPCSTCQPQPQVICNTCQQPVSWAQWGEWGPCIQTGGVFAQTRVRQCSALRCDQGMAQEARSCTPSRDPTATWGQWGPWGQCSASCGGGVQTRQRVCGCGVCQCPGEATQQQPCNQSPCCEWTAWSPWSECSATCGSGGYNSRTRQCSCYSGCQGASSEQSTCSASIACPGAPCTTCGVIMPPPPCNTCGVYPGQRYRDQGVNGIPRGGIPRSQNVNINNFNNYGGTNDNIGTALGDGSNLGNSSPAS